MATRCLIVKDKIATIVNYDAYPEGVGATLEKYYKNPDKVDKLVSMGELKTLGRDLTKDSGTELYYDENHKKDVKSISSATDGFKKYGGIIDYVYIFSGGKWNGYHKGFGKLKDVSKRSEYDLAFQRTYKRILKFANYRRVDKDVAQKVFSNYGTVIDVTNNHIDYSYINKMTDVRNALYKEESTKFIKNFMEHPYKGTNDDVFNTTIHFSEDNNLTVTLGGIIYDKDTAKFKKCVVIVELNNETPIMFIIKNEQDIKDSKDVLPFVASQTKFKSLMKKMKK